MPRETNSGIPGPDAKAITTSRERRITMKYQKQLLAATLSTLFTSTAWATNGMNLEGYGAKSSAMGGAGMAFDTGNSAVMNNPATLAMMPAETTRFGLGVRMLGPDVTASMPGTSADSRGTSYYMPSVSLVRRSGDLTYGAAVLAQGGMGTEYDANSFVAAGSGEEVRSEVGVGRLMLPLAYNATERLNIGGSFDIVWAGMDLKMAVPSANLGSMISSFDAGWSPAISSGFSGASWGRFDFSNDNDFTGKARGYGVAGKLGFTYQATDNLTIGATYHSETDISDLKTEGATLSTDTGGSITGTIKVRDFQWPATYALGLAYRAGDRWLLAADYKRINWSEVMQDFKMTFIEPNMGALNLSMPQNWADQHVVAVGAQYQYSDRLALRFGYNHASNPVPSATMNPLFPAIVEHHITAGFGYRISDHDNLGFALTYAPEVTVTNSNGGGPGVPVTCEHSQINWSLNYVHSFR